MSKTLTIELPDEVYDIIQKMAAQTGRSVEELALEWITRYGPRKRPPLSEEERAAALARLRKYSGAVSSGDPHSADNERIDADLAREYDNNHEDGG
jgi:predicted transcriptional regulator